MRKPKDWGQPCLGSVHVEREDKRRRPSYTDPALTSLYSSRREQDDGLSRRIRAGAGVGRGHAGPDAYHRCAYHRLDRPLCAGRPARHRSGAGPRPASRPGWEWPCAADPGAALVDRTAVGANGCQPAVDPGRAHVAATWAVYSRRARYDARGAVGGLVGGDSRGGGRTMPIGWAVMPYPWPKGRFQTTTIALLQRLQGAFPTNVSWSVVADRGFPSALLFAHLRQAGTAFSVRLRLNTWVTVAGVYAMDGEHLEAGGPRVGPPAAGA